MTSHVLTERAGSVARVTLNRPDSLNALTDTMFADLAAAIEELGQAPDTRVLVLTGSGRGFSAGVDVSSSEGGAPPSPGTVDLANRVTRAIREVPVPVVAAVNGPAAGVGATFALAADIIIARESAFFLLAFANIGLMPDGGATALLPAAVGRIRAIEMALLAERVPAATAAEWGLITRSVPDVDFDTEVDRIVAELANGPTNAYARIKHAINASTLVHLETAFQLERTGQATLLGHPNFTEGVLAFQARRAPIFNR